MTTEILVLKVSEIILKNCVNFDSEKMQLWAYPEDDKGGDLWLLSRGFLNPNFVSKMGGSKNESFDFVLHKIDSLEFL